MTISPKSGEALAKKLEDALKLVAHYDNCTLYAEDMCNNGWSVMFGPDRPVFHARWIDGMRPEITARVEAEARFFAGARDLLREAAALLTEQQNDLEIAQEAAALWRTRLAEKLTDQSRQQEAWEKSYNTILRLIEVAKSEEPQTALARVVIQRLRTVRDAVEPAAPPQPKDEDESA